MKCRLPLLLLAACLLPAAPARAEAAAPPPPRAVVFGAEHPVHLKGTTATKRDREAYSQDLVEVVARAAALNYRIVEKDSWNDLLAALGSGEIDVIPMVARIPERARSMLFSVPHVRGLLVVIMRADQARGVAPADVAGKRLVLRADTYEYAYAKRRGWLEGALILRSGTDGSELEHVVDGSADAAILEEYSAWALMDRLALKAHLAVVMELPDSLTEFCMAVRPTDGALLAQLNEGLFLAQQRGDLQRIHDKWFHLAPEPGYAGASRRRWLLLGGGTLALGLLAWLGIRYGLRKARRRTEEVARLVEARTGELAAANRQLRYSEEKFSKAFLTSPDAICITQVSDETFIDINEGFIRIFGYDRAEVIGQTAVGLSLWNSFTDRDRLMEVLRKEGRVRNVPHLFVRKDGEVRTGSVSMERIKIGVADCTVSIVRDVTDSEQASAALRESEARFRTLVESAPEAILVFDADTRQVTDANEKALKMFEAAREELLALDLGRLAPALQSDGRSSDAALGELIRGALAGGAPDVEWMVQSLRGRPIAVELRLVRLPAAGRNLIRGSLTDITDRRRLEEQLRQAQRMESIGQLAGGVAHDFNNILTVIQCNTSLLLSDKDFPEAYHEAIGQIEQSSTFAAGLTRQLLVFSRKQVIQRASLDVAAAIQRTTRLLRRVIGENIALDVQLESGLPPIFADNGMIEQVLLNLAVNSRDAMPNGGSITIRAGMVERDEAYRRLVPQALEGRFICIAVSDTGSGISPEILPRIFDPFFTTKEVGKGTGLGLATVYGIVQQHQGWIELESRIGVGTEFRVHFPCLTEAAAPAVVAGPVGEREAHSETILVVEDEDFVRLTTCIILKNQGYKIIEASSPKEALELWEAEGSRVDLVFTDVVMPGGMTGRDLVEQLRRVRPGLKALFTSGYSSDLLGRDFARTSANFFLQKPFGAAELTRLVSECLRAA
jgi:PAS domain S-box-containing protein